ncbi:hypothetical protein BGX33_009300 [Mortierella sp. NVP41]|nr:hypothetical protein BGX33_009300 [Mortierella sp. NVP41]
MGSEEQFQSFRRGLDSRVVRIEAYFHEETGQHLVDWDDITEAFPNINCIMNGFNVVSRARDSRRKFIEPRCIKYHHEVVLEVVIGDVFSPASSSTFSPPPMSGTAAPDIHLNRPVSLGSQNFMQFPPETNTPNTPPYRKDHFDMDSQRFPAPFQPPTPSFNPDGNHEQQYRTMSTAKGSDSGGGIMASASSESTSYFPPWHQQHPTQDSDISYEIPISTTTAVARVETLGSSTQSKLFLQRMQSTVQSFEQYIREGQLFQAKVVQQEAESIKQEMAQYYGNLQTEVAKNTTLQNQVKEMMTAGQEMTKRILELQEAALDTDKRMLILQQQALDRLALIHSKATAILTQTYELHEFPIPRLFIILPKEDITKREKIGTMFVKRFRLYFLCECGEHTKPVDGIPSTLSHDIHLARHEGYDLDRPNEFFRKYGSYVLALLQMLKYGVIAAGMVVPPLNSLKVADGLAVAEAGLKVAEKDFAPRVDSAIEYLQGLTAAQDGVSKELGDANSNATLVDPTTINRLEGLEGADLRHLESFLKISDEGKVLGNLYRTVTPQGHVKWVCLDHYRESYGAAALQEFKETVELNRGKYDQRSGRVTVRLVGPTLARQFFSLLLSTRLVHELDLTLDWNTTFEDLRILKNVMQQSNIFYLGLDLCGRTGPTSDFVYRNRRSEPIVQIMASGKVHTMTLRNVTGFLSQTKELLKTTLHLRHFDLGERIYTMDDFVKLEKLIRASPTLIRLSIVVGNIDGAFARLRPLVARHKVLSILDLQLEDGTAASVQFEQGSDQVGAISLKVIEFDSTKLMKMSMVTFVVFLAKNSVFRSSSLIQTAIQDYPRLKMVKIMQLPDGAAKVLQNLRRAMDGCSSRSEINEASVENGDSGSEGGSNVAVAVGDRADASRSGTGFMELDLVHKQSVLWDTVLVVASNEEADTSKESPLVPAIDSHKNRSTFTLWRRDGSLASIRFELDNGVSNSAVLHISDFEASEVFQHSLATKLTVFGGAGIAVFDSLMKASTTEFINLRILELECKPGSLLDVFQVAQLATFQCPVFNRLNIWNSNDRSMKEFSFPLRELHLSDHHFAAEQLPSLQNLLRTASSLSSMTLLIPSLPEAFEIVKSAAQLHKKLSEVHLVAGGSRASIRFTSGSGDIESIALRVRESGLDQLLSLPMITELDLMNLVELSRLKQVTTSVFASYGHLKTFKMIYRLDQLLETVDTLRQVADETFALCQMILFEADDTLRRRRNVFDLPLRTLDITPCIIYDEFFDEKDLVIVGRLIRTSSLLEELYVSVETISIAQRIFDFILRERRPMTILSLTLEDEREAVFSLEKDQEDGTLTIIQKITQAELDTIFFLPAVSLDRVDIVGNNINNPQAAEIATMVLRQCHEVSSIRFPDLPNQVQDIASILEDSIKHGSFIHELERNGGTTDNFDSYFSVSAEADAGITVGADLAVYSVGMRNTEEATSVSSIMRIRPAGTLEVVDLDWSGHDGVTLRLFSVVFAESDLAALGAVKELEVFVDPGSTTLIDNWIRIPIEAYPDLLLLQVVCPPSLHLNALLAALDSAANHPVLEQLRISHIDDQTTTRLTYDLPIKTIDLSWCRIPSTKYSILSEIISACPSLLEFTAKVSSPHDIFKTVCSSAGKHGSLTRLDLHGQDGALVSVCFKQGTSEMVAVILALTDIPNPTLQWETPVPNMMLLSDSSLELIGAIQEVTIDNPGLQSFVLKDKDHPTRLTCEIPFRKIDMGKHSMPLDHVKSLRRLLMVCPLLTELSLAVFSIPDLCSVIELVGPVYTQFKKLSDVQLKLPDGAEASLRFSKNGKVGSTVALRISSDFSTELFSVPGVKKVTFRSKDTSRQSDFESLKLELNRILTLFTGVETLEYDHAVDSPFPALLAVLDYKENNPSRPFRRFRHWVVDSSKKLITYDLPLRKLDFGDYFVTRQEFTELVPVFRASLQLYELTLAFPTSAVIDPVHEMLVGMPSVYCRLSSLTLKSSDGYLASFGLTGPWSYPSHAGSSLVRSLELQASGTEWPKIFHHSKVTKLTIMPAVHGATEDKNDDDDDNSIGNSRIYGIASTAFAGIIGLKHLVLTCSVKKFFQLLPVILDLKEVFDLVLEDPVDHKTIISTKVGHTSMAFIRLDKISDQDFQDDLGYLFPRYVLQVGILQREGKVPLLTVIMDCVSMVGEQHNAVRQVEWDTRNVSCRRVFELLDKFVTSTRRSFQSFQLKWRTESTGGRGEGGEGKRPQADEILSDDETGDLLTRLLVRGGVWLDIEYEGMAALLPFVKSDIERVDEWQVVPFSSLEQYVVYRVEDPVQPEVLEFQSMIPGHVRYSFNIPGLSSPEMLSSFHG